ncbi:hypothetical protein KBI52_06995 [Microvirga sp. HBU67558]|nr:hypothetical protein [Microvirga sp. HBU67558]
MLLDRSDGTSPSQLISCFGQIVREGDVTRAWLIAGFGARTRRVTLVAQAVTLEQTLTDAAITMLNKLIGHFFYARAHMRRRKRYVEAHQDTTKVLCLFRTNLLHLAASIKTRSGHHRQPSSGWQPLAIPASSPAPSASSDASSARCS